MRIAIFGSGGVGGYFGGRLAESGADVTFIARGTHLQAMKSAGLRVDSIKGDFLVHPVKATDNVSDASIFDVVVSSVKAWQVAESAHTLSAIVGPQTFILTLQNGVEAPGEYAKIFGNEKVVPGLCHIISSVIGPGHIRHSGAEPRIAFGESNNEKSARTEKLRDLFEKSGIRVTIPENIQTALWEKFLFIASLSGMGAVTRAPAGILRSLPETRKMLESAMLEIFELARVSGVALSDDIIQKTMAFVDSLPGHGTASMQRDIMAGRPSELEAQNGAVARIAANKKIPAPVNEFIYKTLLPLELIARGKIEYPGNGVL
ncbi:MAG: 2-dehydropantoate 2-reductase [Calditrichaceae bacterium]